MKRLGISRPSPAMMVAVVALVFAMVGTGYAAFKLPKNSVGGKQIKKSAVTSVKVKDQTLTGKDINLAKLGTVPAATNAGHASTADLAGSLTPPEATRLVGAPGQPPFEGGSSPYVPEGSPLRFPAPGFFKDHEGVVHLEGVAKTGSTGELAGLVFKLPPGYRPANGTIQVYEPLDKEQVIVFGSNVFLSGFDLSGAVLSSSGKEVLLSGITYRAES